MNKEQFDNNMLNWITIIFIGVALLFYGAHLGQAIHVERALYADGANFFVDLLNKQSVWPIADDPKHIRLFVNFINQLPVAFALELGVEDLRLLRILFGAGLFLAPVFIYAYCFILSRRVADYRVFFFAMVSMVTCAMPSEIFILNQSFTALALAWVLVHYILLGLNLRRFDWFIIVLVSIILFRAHESLMVWGGIFVFSAAAVIWVRDSRRITNANLHVYTIGLLGLAQLAFVIYWQATHPVGQQTSAFLKLIGLVKPSELWVGSTRISLLLAVLLLAVFASDLLRRYRSDIGGASKEVFIFLFVSIGCFLVATGAMSLFQFDLTSPYREYSYRFLITFGSAGWMSLSIVAVLGGWDLKVQARRLCVIALSLGMVSASMWQISNNIQWSIFKNAAIQELNSQTDTLIDPVRVKDRLALYEQEIVYKYRWDWTWPVFGMSLQNDGRVERLFRPEGYDEYFKPPAMVPFVRFDGEGFFDFGAFRITNSSRP